MLPSMWKMKKDLKRAGIEYENDDGRADFHSLRHTLATNLVHRNVAPRVAMEILRHSDIRLTMNYTDASLLPLADAIGKLPAFGPADSCCDNTQQYPQTRDISCNRQSPCGTVSTRTRVWCASFSAMSGRTRLGRRIKLDKLSRVLVKVPSITSPDVSTHLWPD
jgi:hypothetical protein